MLTETTRPKPTLEQMQSCLQDLNQAAKDLHKSMFSQCCSNPIFNAWGQQVDMTAYANLQDASSKATEMLATVARTENPDVE